MVAGCSGKMNPLGRMKVIGGSAGGRTCVAPESAGIRIGVIEHKRAGVVEFSSNSSSSELSDSNTSNGLGCKNGR